MILTVFKNLVSTICLAISKDVSKGISKGISKGVFKGFIKTMFVSIKNKFVKV